ncbi:hypothetical protein ACH5RR_032584 [Cinchona calisaya]|uniref:F-box domain-containing protein n=1 Tax=Cinchona calisaya TaxID=153742 RepID=A0ABD2YLN4_9GENT
MQPEGDPADKIRRVGVSSQDKNADDFETKESDYGSDESGKIRRYRCRHQGHVEASSQLLMRQKTDVQLCGDASKEHSENRQISVAAVYQLNIDKGADGRVGKPHSPVNSLLSKVQSDSKVKSIAQEQQSYPFNMDNGVSFPDDIMLYLFSRLPAKSIIRFGSVCRSWFRSLVYGSEFCREHLRRQPSRVLFKEDDKFLRSCEVECLNAETPTQLENIQSPIYISYGTKLVGSSHGLICTANGDHDEITICNPSTGKKVLLPGLKTGRNANVHGFAWLNDSYIVVAVASTISYINSEPKYDSWLNIFRQESGQWLRLPDIDGCLFPSAIFVEEKLHWLCRCYNKFQGSCKKIFRLHVRDNNYGWLDMPILGEECLECSPQQVGGLLGLLCRYPSKMDIWMMKQHGREHSWEVLSLISNIDDIKSCIVVCLMGEGKELVLKFGSRIAIYDMEKGTLKFAILEPVQVIQDAIQYFPGVVSPDYNRILPFKDNAAETDEQ